MSKPKTQPLAPGYKLETVIVDEPSWCELVQRFQDGNLHQTGSCASLVGSRSTLFQLALTLNGNVVAIALVKVRKLPIIGLGVATVYRGPLWRLAGTDANVEIFRQAVRALRNEFVCKQGLVLRLYPSLFEDDPFGLRSIIENEGFCLRGNEAHSRTILMSLEPSLADIREAFSSHWRRNLRAAEKNTLECVEGTSVELFDDFLSMYNEMHDRKKFTDAVDVRPYREVQAQLPEPLKMRILLCRSEARLCAGVIYSLIGDTAVFLFGATSNAGMKARGSYLLWWNVIQALKQRAAATYDLNGINPVHNPGTYRFKSGFAGKHGRDVFYMGRFDARAGFFSHALIQIADGLRLAYRHLQQRFAATWQSATESVVTSSDETKS
jgi:hypothetical protein